MARRKLFSFLILIAAVASTGASFRSQNFIVEAANAEIARQVAEYAEHYRREKALQWLGFEMQPWPEPCPLRVTVTMKGSSGATTFAFDQGQVLGQSMHIEGTLERLLASVLPHEVTHTVFAYHFRQPVPRWADEGGSVLSEDEIERRRHDKLVWEILSTPRRFIPLRRLLELKTYPNDVMVLYAQGYSVTEFLVSKSSRPAFLNFIADGMRSGWDNALRTHYGYQSVEQLEKAWLQAVQNRAVAPPAAVASAQTGQNRASDSRVVTRQTVPPAQPLLEAPQPVVRGSMPQQEDCKGGTCTPASMSAGANWNPPRTPEPAPRPAGPVVTLGAPEKILPPPPPLP